jgi:hypothetical protein
MNVKSLTIFDDSRFSSPRGTIFTFSSCSLSQLTKCCAVIDFLGARCLFAYKWPSEGGIPQIQNEFKFIMLATMEYSRDCR